MKGTKTQKGITLIALIITILVLMILAVVTINSLQEGGIVTHAENAASSYKQAQIDEEIKLYSMEYTLKTQKSLKEDTVNEMTQVSKETGVSPEKLTVHYNSKDQSEYVLYRIDKVTAEERTILENFKNEELGIDGVKPLIGDLDFDGVLTQEDLKILDDAASWIIDQNELTEIQKEMADMNKDTYIDGSDVSTISGILKGNDIYTGGYIQ